MSNYAIPTHRYGGIKRRIQRAASEHERHVRQAWIDRVLSILDHENLVTQAAAGQATGDDLLFDCNVAPLVWDDPRIAYRVRQLEASQLTVEIVDREATIAGKIFKRTQIKVAFST
jgi:hypothetical protein